MQTVEKEPSEVSAEFLNYIDSCMEQYQAVGLEDRRAQDLMHELEFSNDRNHDRRLITRIKHSRRNCRHHKDEALKYEYIVDFFQEPQNKKALNCMRQLLGKQRKREEYLKSERQYHLRVPEG